LIANTAGRKKFMFFGSIPALVTPFSGDCVDQDSLRDLIEWQIDEGSNGLVPCGTTGEAATLSTDEHRGWSKSPSRWRGAGSR
jgi:dihydrodipicolinate synthase/N-acetylneuraminate lyase